MERYEKHGIARRIEFVRGEWFALRVEERGRAISSSNSFRTESQAVNSSAGEEMNDQFEPLRDALASYPIERASFTDGQATHSIDDHEGKREWASRDEIALITLSVPSGTGVTATLLPSQAPAWIRRTTSLLTLEPASRPFQREPTMLEPMAAAQLWAWLAKVNTASQPLFSQRSRSATDRDGAGRTIDESSGAPSRRPNVFRPSYRFPPSREPLHVQASAMGEPVDCIGRIMHLEDFRMETGAVSSQGLIATEKEVFSARVSLRVDSIRFISDRQEWFPIAAGVWGGDVVIEASVDSVDSRHQGSARQKKQARAPAVPGG